MDDVMLLDQVREIMADAWDVRESELPGNVSQATYAEWTSFNQMVLLVALEECFGLQFTMNEMMAMTSLPRIVTVLRGRQVAARR
ncbi:MAG TPA: acyl carrier protein [Chloroflexia bacterium]|nr:acyl carrier protein [Chloroflexia bacterium]